MSNINRLYKLFVDYIVGYEAANQEEKLDILLLFSNYSLYIFLIILFYLRQIYGFAEEVDQQLYYSAWFFIFPVALLLMFVTSVAANRLFGDYKEHRQLFFRVPTIYNLIYWVVILYISKLSRVEFSVQVSTYILVYSLISWFTLAITVYVIHRYRFFELLKTLSIVGFGISSVFAFGLIMPPLSLDTLDAIHIMTAIMALTVLPSLGYKQSILVCIGIVAVAFVIMLDIPLQHVAITILILMFLMRIPEFQLRRIKAVLPAVIILIASLHMLNLEFPMDRTHYNTYLGSLNDLAHGKTMLVDTSNQYGLLSFYLMSFVFSSGLLPLNYVGLSLFNSLATISVLIIGFFIVKYITKSNGLAALAIFVPAYFINDLGNWSQIIWPDIGVFRYWMLFVMPFAIYARYRWYNTHRFAYLFEFVLLGIALYWDIVVASYTLAGYLMLIGFETLMVSNSVGNFGRTFFRRALSVLAVAIIGLISIYVFTWLRAGSFPQWDLYFDHFTYFSERAQNYRKPIKAWHIDFWVLVLEYLTLAGILLQTHRLRKESWYTTALIVFIVSAGIVGMYLYIRGSVPFVLVFQYIPALYAILYWISSFRNIQILSYSVSSIAKNTAWSIFIVLIVVSNFTIRTKDSNKSYTRLPFSTSVKVIIDAFTQPEINSLEMIPIKWNLGIGVFHGTVTLWDTGNSIEDLNDSVGVYNSFRDNTVVDTVALAQLYSPNEDRLGVFIDVEANTHALLNMGKTHAYPIDNVGTEPQSYAVINLIESASPLEVGDIIYVQRQLDQLIVKEIFATQSSKDTFDEAFLKNIVLGLCEQYSFGLLDVSPSGVVALELLPHIDGVNCTDDLKFSQIRLDVGGLYDHLSVDDQWQGPEVWDIQTIRWMRQQASLSIPACVDTPAELTMRIFSPSPTDVTLEVTLSKTTHDITLSEGWGDYSLELDESVCSDKMSTKISLSTDYQLNISTDTRELSFAADYLIITSQPSS